MTFLHLWHILALPYLPFWTSFLFERRATTSKFAPFRHWKFVGNYARLTISASALTESMVTTLTLTFSPILTLGTKIQKPLKVAKPSPFGLIWLISTSYSSPIVTGQLSRWRLFFAFLGLLFLGLIESALPFWFYLHCLMSRDCLSIPHKNGRLGILVVLSATQMRKCFNSQALNWLMRLMPSVAKRKAKNTQNEQRKKMEREKEAKKKQMRQQLPPKGKKR